MPFANASELPLSGLRTKGLPHRGHVLAPLFRTRLLAQPQEGQHKWIGALDGTDILQVGPGVYGARVAGVYGRGKEMRQ